MLNETLYEHDKIANCKEQRLQTVRAQERRLRRQRRLARSVPRHTDGWSVRMF
jgi:hypothetical protein